jgi:hypothetical protein|tara:strand:- start:1511 stop:1993 length:483 start_codon:yes stop_codon:yes gene_type:complete
MLIIIKDNQFNIKESKDLIKIFNEAPDKKTHTVNEQGAKISEVIINSKKLPNIILDKFKAVIEPYNLEVNWLNICKWPVGAYQPKHLDNSGESGLPDPVFTSIHYLNDDYKGGETYFEDGVKVEPKLGRGLYFSGMEYKHGVRTVHMKPRYTLATWYKKR